MHNEGRSEPSAVTTRSRGPGRPRSASTHTAILNATIDLLSEVGYDALSIEGVAARAGVGKQTIYRRFASKNVLIGFAVVENGDRVTWPDSVPDTGDIHADLVSWIEAGARAWSDPRQVAIIRALSAASAEDAEVAAELYDRFTGPGHEELAERLRAEQVKGSVDAAADTAAVADAMFGGLLYLALARHDLITETRARGLVNALLFGIVRQGLPGRSAPSSSGPPSRLRPSNGVAGSRRR
jgi:AcrR family transcriptional regulator